MGAANIPTDIFMPKLVGMGMRSCGYHWAASLGTLHRRLARLDNLDLGLRPVPGVGLLALDLADHLHRLVVEHLTKHHVLAVQPGGLHGGDEELAAVGVLAR